MREFAHSVKLQSLTSKLRKLERELSSVEAAQGIDAFFEEDAALKVAETKLQQEIDNLKSQIEILNQEEN